MKPKIISAAFLLLILLFLNVQIAMAESETTTIKIEVMKNGSAIWSAERRILLQDEADLEAWNNSTRQSDKSQMLETYTKEMSDYVAQSKIATKRSMFASDFDLIYSLSKTPTGNYGTITYKFTWNGFAKVDNGKIFIGDVFFEGIVLLEGSTFIIKMPSGYEALDSRPKSDKVEEDQVIWEGKAYREFKAGEPAVVLAEKSFDITHLATIALLIIIAAIAVLKRDSLMSLIGKITKESIPETDEALILALLEPRGEMYQSEIVEKSGFSKSKVSLLLEDLKQKDRIVKIRKGKENLIRLKK